MTVKLSTLANPKATSGTPVEVRDEGVQKTTGVSSFDFTGAGVTVTATGGAVEVNIPGGGGGVTDHGALTGLGDDDHTQYHTDARGDIRYTIQNGFEDRAQSTISFVEGTRVFTLTPVGTCYFWSHGVRFSKTTAQNITIANTEGIHYIFFNASGVLEESSSYQIDGGDPHAFIAAIYYDATNSVAVMIADERHGRAMDVSTHMYLHNTHGSLWARGLGLANIISDGAGSLNTHAQVSVNSGSIWDEDIQHVISSYSFPASIPFLYRLGASGLWRKIIGSGFVVTPTGTGRAAWNKDTAGTWALQETTTGNYMLMHLMATGNFNQPLAWILGQAEYTTLANARLGADSEVLKLSMDGLITLMEESVPLATLIIQTSNSYSNDVKSRIRTLADGSSYVDWRGASPIAAGGQAVITDHSLLSNLAEDDHTQYHNDARGDVRYAPIAKGVTNGDSHDHSGGDGAQIDHGGLAGLADDDHTQYHTDARGDIRYDVQNGYEDRTQSTFSFVGATRVFTHTPSGTCYLWSGDTRYAKSGVETVTLANTEGLHYVYFDTAGVLQETTTFSPSIITTFAFVAAVYFDATNAQAVIMADERHGREMDGATHSYLHNTVGARWGEGLGLASITADGSGDLAIHAQVAVNGGSIWDEDIKHTISALALPAAVPFLYRLGATGAWRKLASTGYVVTPTGTGRAAWNRNNAGTWSLQEIATGNYVLMHLIATGDITTPMFWIVGQAEYTTLANARTGADVEWNSLSLGGLVELAPEFVICATIVINTATGYANAVKSRIRTLADGSTYVDWRKTSGSAAGGVGGVTDHTLLTNIGTNTHDQIDTHLGSTSNPHSVTAAQAGALPTSAFSGVAKITVGTSAPGSPAIGDLWIDTN